MGIAGTADIMDKGIADIYIIDVVDIDIIKLKELRWVQKDRRLVKRAHT